MTPIFEEKNTPKQITLKVLQNNTSLFRGVEGQGANQLFGHWNHLQSPSQTQEGV